MKPLRFARGVEAEIESAAEYYDTRAVGLGAAFLDALDEALELLVERPDAHPSAVGTAPGEGIRQVALRRFPYRVVFRERTTDLLILACRHVRQLPGYWRDRDKPP